MSFDLSHYLRERKESVDRALDRFLPPADAFPPAIHEAMRYSVFAGGKRVRPILVIASAEVAGGQRPSEDSARPEAEPGQCPEGRTGEAETNNRAREAEMIEPVLPTACAFELIHTYSLIHDDLPAMDDDDFRRGRPTSHKVFGEAVAILAGDALFTLGVRLLAESFLRGVANPALLPQLLAEVTEAAGTPGMIGGQVVDIQSEGRVVSAETLEYIHAHKTGALIRAAVRAGALLAGASAETLSALMSYGERLGLAFQIVDDILDLEGDEETMGKAVGSDQRKKKVTYPDFYGLEPARKMAADLIREAKEALYPFGGKATPLRALADLILSRNA